MKHTTVNIDIYPVGWLKALRHAGGCLRRLWLRRAWYFIRKEWRYTRYQVRAGDWRAVRNTLNGYLAESAYGRRCGTGWTRKRALRSLYCHLDKELLP